MITRIQKWGNSQGLRLSRELLADVNVEVGDAVEVSALDGSLVITPARRVRGGLDLAELVGRIPEDYEPEEDTWGAAVGLEVW
jgi:antitoxin MazE